MLPISKNYGWVIISATAIGLQCYFTGFIIPMGERKKAFGKEFMEKNFGEIHRAEVGSDIPLNNLGYPDMGSGKYAEKLPYKDWYNLNIAMRTHYQFLEQVPMALTFLLLGGLSAPIPAAGLGFAYFGGRLLYTTGYQKGGPAGRSTGAGIANGSVMGMSLLSVYSGLRLLRYAKF